MTTRKPLPSRAELQELFVCDPDRGVLFWKERPRSAFKSKRSYDVFKARKAGLEALNSVGARGYRIGRVLGGSCYAHRIIWKMATGEDPEQIDHIDGNRQNNSICNLRSVSNLENSRNRKISKANTSGTTGVSWSKPSKRWIARIKHGQKYEFLGSFKTKEGAIAARKKAEQNLGFHQNHGRAA